MPKLVHLFIGRSVSSQTLAYYLSPYHTALIFTARKLAGPTLASMEKEVGSGIAASSRETAAIQRLPRLREGQGALPPAMVKTTLFLSRGMNAHFPLQSPGFSVICPSLKTMATKGERGQCPLNDLMIFRVPFLPSS